MTYSHSILFVDDQEDVLTLINRILKDEKYNKFFAKNVLEAMEIVNKEKIDVIVTDMIMPNVSGLQLLELIKSTHPHIVRVVLSGYSQVPSILDAINKGDIFRYITKPWKVNDQGKMILREAIEYSDYIKENSKETNNYSKISIDKEELKNIMKLYNKEFFIIVDNKLLTASDNEITKNLEELLSAENLCNYDKHQLNSNTSIYIKK
ncbi:response regulator [Clostridium cellulovorans]|uniref:Stage 0 sporulation protein A homolog n=1 Tax=Clostridium cellulovorans (strain ATCC 35296 / DSM 3052 / OCM 3 / 743B) TaxID=573061 RepID=D9STB4_CLOC7|nr:response regulator [Clostridium cellulovorans]ADL50730.1 response regulator receiver protein [Clostridium cellulovorans 743B]